MGKNSSWIGAAEVAHYLKDNSMSKAAWQLRWKPVCASTQKDLARWLFDHPMIDRDPRAMISGCQRFGRGQYARSWMAPKGGVWLSAALPGFKTFKNNQLFGLAVAVGLSERIEKRGVCLKIKWPNDLIFKDRKLAGFLPKLVYRGDTLRLATIGVGLNVFNPVPSIGISLSEILGYKSFNLSKWSAEVLIAIERSIELLSDQTSLCAKANKRLWAKETLDPRSGIRWNIKGIDEVGGLKLFSGTKEITWHR